jgi:branched-chain amino acid transport system permease protein
MTDLLPQLVVNGIVSGSLYMLLGLSFGIIYSTTGTFHFAHALVITVAAYAAVVTTGPLTMPWMRASSETSAGFGLIVGLLAAILAAALAGCLIELLIYRPLRESGASQFGVFIGSLGTLIVGQNVILLIFKALARPITGFPYQNFELGSVAFTNLHVIIVTLCALAVLGLWLFLKRTGIGIAIRAVASNPEMAEAVGVDRGTITLLVYALGSGAAGIAAFLIALNTAATPSMGATPVFSALIVTFVGGIGSIPGAVAAGYLLGMAQNLGMLFVQAQWQAIIAFIVLIVAIIVRPQGLLPLNKEKR